MKITTAIFIVSLFSLVPLFAVAGSVSTGCRCSSTANCASGLICQQYAQKKSNVTYGVCVSPNARGAQFIPPAVSCGVSVNQSNQISGQKCDQSKGLCNPLKAKSISGLLKTILSYLIKIGTVIIILMLVVTGFRFVLARGNPTELEKARNMLMWTLIGALIILGAQAIATSIGNTVTAITQ